MTMQSIDWPDPEVRAICTCASNREAWRLLQEYVRRTKRQSQAAAVWARRRELMAKCKVERKAEQTRAAKTAFWANRAAEASERLAAAGARSSSPSPASA